MLKLLGKKIAVRTSESSEHGAKCLKKRKSDEDSGGSDESFN